ncbi:hypothetical protein, partial [Nonomuraea basaltis]|uniref:hypothetical protein n=1 Tax=Nonomuraea basaltis TaxID=2495887 RepID=UPI001981B8B6
MPAGSQLPQQRDEQAAALPRMRLLEPVGEMIGDFLEGESYEAVEHQRLFMIRQGIPASFLPDR